MTDFLLIRCFGVSRDDETTLRKGSTTLACFLALFDIYTDINTVYTLYTSQEDQLCSYNCPAVLASILSAFILYSLLSQAKYVYYAYNKNICYGFLSLFGYGPIVIALDMWDEIGTNNTKFKRFFIIRWKETTQEALPAAAIQIVVLLFFSTSLTDAQEVNTLIEVKRLQSTILIFVSIILSLWSVGNGTRKYCAFVGGFSKPIWYYYALALYTATDMFNRSLVLSLFFVSLLHAEQFDVYIIVVVFSVILHQILFQLIDNSRIKKGDGKGTDNGKVGRCIKANTVTFVLFVILYMILPSSVVFLRNFHVKEAKISFWITWINGTGYVLSGILFFALRVTSDSKYFNELYTAGVIYLVSFNLIPFILVLCGRLKTRNVNELEIPETRKQFTIDMTQIDMTGEEELNFALEKEEREKDRLRKIEKVREENERLKALKAEEIRKKDEVKAKRMKEQKEKERAKRMEQKRAREIKDKSIRQKQKEEDDRRRAQYEAKKAKRARGDEDDDDAKSDVSSVSALSIKIVQSEKPKRKRRSSDYDIAVIQEGKETNFKSTKSKTPVPKSKSKDVPKWNILKSSENKKKRNKRKANSDELQSKEIQKKKTEAENKNKAKKLKLDAKSVSVQEKRKKHKNKRSSSLTPVTAKEKVKLRENASGAKKLKLDNKTDSVKEKKKKKKKINTRSASLTPLTEKAKLKLRNNESGTKNNDKKKKKKTAS